MNPHVDSLSARLHVAPDSTRLLSGQELGGYIAPEFSLAPARQQPDWHDVYAMHLVRQELRARDPLVEADEIRLLHAQLAAVAEGKAVVMQSGDCAEDPSESTARDIARKTAVLDILAGALKLKAHLPVVRVGRIAGQYAKPRSSPVETVGDIEVPSFRGHLINRPEPDAESRRADAWRMLDGYDAAQTVIGHLAGPSIDGYPIDSRVWTSHEALVLDYEIPLIRRDGHGNLVLTSTHWPWIGERTRGADEAHVQVLSLVTNPVACKVGPGVEASELLGLCERLDPQRRPGRLTLIPRMGARAAGHRLRGLVEAVAAAGHPVIWMSDPLHANTVNTPAGTKIRYLSSIVEEVHAFLTAVRAGGGVTGGLHLETTPEDVLECVSHPAEIFEQRDRYRSHCDPRLTVAQALRVVDAWD